MTSQSGYAHSRYGAHGFPGVSARLLLAFVYFGRRSRHHPTDFRVFRQRLAVHAGEYGWTAKVSLWFWILSITRHLSSGVHGFGFRVTLRRKSPNPYLHISGPRNWYER